MYALTPASNCEAKKNMKLERPYLNVATSSPPCRAVGNGRFLSYIPNPDSEQGFEVDENLQLSKRDVGPAL